MINQKNINTETASAIPMKRGLSKTIVAGDTLLSLYKMTSTTFAGWSMLCLPLWTLHNIISLVSILTHLHLP